MMSVVILDGDVALTHSVEPRQSRSCHLIVEQHHRSHLALLVAVVAKEDLLVNACEVECRQTAHQSRLADRSAGRMMERAESP